MLYHLARVVCEYASVKLQT